MQPPEKSQAPLGDDLLEGMGKIAHFYGLPPRKCFHLASSNLLPGVFKIGRRYFLSKSVAREKIAERARGA